MHEDVKEVSVKFEFSDTGTHERKGQKAHDLALLVSFPDTNVGILARSCGYVNFSLMWIPKFYGDMYRICTLLFLYLRLAMEAKMYTFIFVEHPPKFRSTKLS